MKQQIEQTVYKLCSLKHWQQSKTSGYLLANDDDIRDGFIHLSTAKQVIKIAQKYYMQTPNLYLLGICVTAISGILRLETNSKGEMFPHAYGDISIADILFARAVPVKSSNYTFPKDLF